jgi:hypothetical protein
MKYARTILSSPYLLSHYITSAAEKVSLNNQASAHPEFIQIELPVLTARALAIGQDATA